MFNQVKVMHKTAQICSMESQMLENIEAQLDRASAFLNFVAVSYL